MQNDPKKALMPIPLERELIQSTLERNRGNISQTAKDLGLSKRGLRIKIDTLGINPTPKNED
jgi:DNA-binding NtrC family response regulator